MLVWLLPLLTVLVWLWLHRPRRHPDFPPGPPTFLVFGCLFETLELLRGNIRGALRERRRRYGDINCVVSPTGIAIVNVCRYEDIKEACSMPELTGRPQFFALIVRSFMKKGGIIFNDGLVWSEQRRFSLRHLKDLGLGRSSMEEGILAEFNLLREEMEQDVGTPMRMNGRFNITVLNILWRIIASERFDPADPEAQKYAKLIDEFVAEIGPQNILSLAPWLRFVAPERSGYNSLVRQRDTIVNMFLKLIQQHRETLDPANPRDLIDRFLVETDAPDAAERGFTERDFAVTGMDFFFAGMETTSSTLTWALLYMAAHPEWQRRVQEELDRVLAGRPIAGADRQALPLTDAVLMEVLRCAPVVPRAVPHAALTDCTLGGFRIPRGAAVMMDLEAVHMDAAYWGDPHTFRPERFIDADGKARRDERLIPFGVGRRFCLGEQLARAELLLLFGALLQRFEFRPPPGERLDLEGEYGALLRPAPFSLVYSVRE